MKKQIIVVVFIVLLPWGFFPKEAHADGESAFTDTVEFSYNRTTVPDRRFPDSDEVLRTPFKKIEYLTSQVSGIGYGRPGTEEFLNADILVKLNGDKNIYGMSLLFADSHGHGPNSALFDTFMTAFIHDFKVEIVYYDKKGAKQIIKVTVMK
ncbi:MAG: hypothetical protein MRJ65_15825 [Candidatus Brocadiaceae bacterium]|nr:hypothetical protein [Candidatus Brocadiaceae bacterium]